MIREATISDARIIGEIIVETWKTAYTGLVSEDYIKSMKIEKYKVIIETNIQNHMEKLLVYEDEDTIYGFISGKESEGYGEVIGLYVIPEKQKKGIGRMLLNEMKKRFKEKGYSEMILWTLYKAKNNVFYEKEKGEILKRKDMDIGNKKYNGICYSFNIGKDI